VRDGYADGVATFFAIEMIAADGEGRPTQGDGARGGGTAIAPVDAGTVVARFNRSAQIGEGRHRLSRRSTSLDRTEGEAAAGHYVGVGDRGQIGHGLGRGILMIDGDRDGEGPFIGVRMAAEYRERRPRKGDTPRRGRAAIAPVNAGAVVREQFRSTRIGEGGYGLHGRSSVLGGREGEAAGGDHAGVGYRDGVGHRLRGGGLVIDGHRDGEDAFIGIGMVAADGEGGRGQGDAACRGGAAIAPIDAGGVVVQRFWPTGIGEGGYRLVGQDAPSGEREGQATGGHHIGIGHVDGEGLLTGVAFVIGDLDGDGVAAFVCKDVRMIGNGAQADDRQVVRDRQHAVAQRDGLAIQARTEDDGIARCAGRDGVAQRTGRAGRGAVAGVHHGEGGRCQAVFERLQAQLGPPLGMRVEPRAMASMGTETGLDELLDSGTQSQGKLPHTRPIVGHTSFGQVPERRTVIGSSHPCGTHGRVPQRRGHIPQRRA